MNEKLVVGERGVMYRQRRGVCEGPAPEIQKNDLQELVLAMNPVELHISLDQFGGEDVWY